MTVFNLPNSITFVRIILLPVFVIAMVYKRYDAALALFVIASISDALDGLLARMTNQKTALGAFLDPLADKILMTTSFIMFSIFGLLPTWLTITVISRDLIVTIGWFLLNMIYNISKIEPLFTGKAANASQLILIAYILFSINLNVDSTPHPWMLLVVASLTIVSGCQYTYRGLRQASEK
ncbi:MAG: CDP-diacylglycerol--glycerol-3-phosphate 3-phosphatidyltransferase [Nitrospirae bacterium]|nr:CDP-diacylglycerol--glycerol-3-phosphate 3-phosphatidyltransferase [Nitrospirota bacterium]